MNQSVTDDLPLFSNFHKLYAHFFFSSHILIVTKITDYIFQIKVIKNIILSNRVDILYINLH